MHSDNVVCSYMSLNCQWAKKAGEMLFGIGFSEQ